MLTPEQLRYAFDRHFGGAARIFSAPGRVNLIGEHTDYNEGFVLPLALDRRTYVAARERADKLLRVRAEDLGQYVEFQLGPGLQAAGNWSDYVRGPAACLLRAGYELQGADLLLASDVPLGAGLSSSAALETAVGYALLQLNGHSINLLELALLLQKAEHEFVGTKCGVMDQYIAGLGQAGHALLIDCRTLGNEAVALDLSATRLVICNSQVKHELAASAYNTRRAECEEGVWRLARRLPDIHSLRDLEIEEFDAVADTLPETIRRRCNHVLTENARVLQAVAALRQNDWAKLGQLLYASHASLRDDYEVSCQELDLLVELAAALPGIYGARLTGGGFGGCTINLVAAAQAENFVQALQSGYQKAVGITPQCYICEASAGVTEHQS